MTTQRRCWSCGTIFINDFGYFKCNVCLQAERQAKLFEEESRRNREHQEWLVGQQMRQEVIQNQPPPVYYPELTQEELEKIEKDKEAYREYRRRNYVPLSSEEIQKKKEIKRIDKFLSLLVDCSLPVTWVLLWLITSGWVTIVTFIAAIAIPFYLNEKHSVWKTENAKYLYQI